MIEVTEHLTFQVNNNKGTDLLNIKEFLSFEAVYGYDLPVGVLKVRTTWDKLFKFVPQSPGDVLIYDCLIGDGNAIQETFRGKLVRYIINPVADEVNISLSLLGLWKLSERVIKAWEGNSPSVIEGVAKNMGVCCKKCVHSKFSDKMKWIQSESSKRFIAHVWRHSFS